MTENFDKPETIKYSIWETRTETKQPKGKHFSPTNKNRVSPTNEQKE